MLKLKRNRRNRIYFVISILFFISTFMFSSCASNKYKISKIELERKLRKITKKHYYHVPYVLESKLNINEIIEIKNLIKSIEYNLKRKDNTNHFNTKYIYHLANLYYLLGNNEKFVDLHIQNCFEQELSLYTIFSLKELKYRKQLISKNKSFKQEDLLKVWRKSKEYNQIIKELKIWKSMKISNILKVDQLFAFSIARAESNLDKNAVSAADAKGIFQITKETFDLLKKKYQFDFYFENINNPIISAEVFNYVYLDIVNSYEINDLVCILEIYNSGKNSYKGEVKYEIPTGIINKIENIEYPATRRYVEKVFCTYQILILLRFDLDFAD